MSGPFGQALLYVYVQGHWDNRTFSYGARTFARFINTEQYCNLIYSMGYRYPQYSAILCLLPTDVFRGSMDVGF